MVRKAITMSLMIGTLILSSCVTEYISAPLPDFSPMRPERPTLEEVEEDVPMGAVLNTVRLIDYAKQLEQYGDSWENFYRIIQEERNDGKV